MNRQILIIMFLTWTNFEVVCSPCVQACVSIDLCYIWNQRVRFFLQKLNQDFNQNVCRFLRLKVTNLWSSLKRHLKSSRSLLLFGAGLSMLLCLVFPPKRPLTAEWGPTTDWAAWAAAAWAKRAVLMPVAAATAAITACCCCCCWAARSGSGTKRGRVTHTGNDAFIGGGQSPMFWINEKKCKTNSRMYETRNSENSLKREIIFRIYATDMGVRCISK